MFYNILQQARVVENFGRACGFLVAAEIFDIDALMEHMKESECVKNILSGSPLFIDSSKNALARCIAMEIFATNEQLDKVTQYILENKINTYAFWLAKTELDIAIKLDKTIDELREIISAEELQKHYYIYHMFFDTDRIIAEQYLRNDNEEQRQQ